MKVFRVVVIHGVLFATTLFTTAIAGVQWLNKDPLELSNLPSGIIYALLIMFVLGSHEMGHYISARWHRIEATLPYFLPFPSILGLFPFGTLGAVIKVKSPISERNTLFDIGVSGPIAGFVATMIVLGYGFLTLPPLEYLYEIHPEYMHLTAIPTEGLRFGDSAFFRIAAQVLAPKDSFVPPMNEVYHYPFLCVGWFGLFVTALNLIPVGQLDGGHIAYAMFNRLHHPIGQIALVLLATFGGLGLLPLLGIETHLGWPGWLLWAMILAGFLRLSRFQRPTVALGDPLDPVRRGIGWGTFVIFVGSFSIVPLSL